MYGAVIFTGLPQRCPAAFLECIDGVYGTGAAAVMGKALGFNIRCKSRSTCGTISMQGICSERAQHSRRGRVGGRVARTCNVQGACIRHDETK